jgi:hypothetical protein
VISEAWGEILRDILGKAREFSDNDRECLSTEVLGKEEKSLGEGLLSSEGCKLSQNEESSSEERQVSLKANIHRHWSLSLAGNHQFPF